VTLVRTRCAGIWILLSILSAAASGEAPASPDAPGDPALRPKLKISVLFPLQKSSAVISQMTWVPLIVQVTNQQTDEEADFRGVLSVRNRNDAETTRLRVRIPRRSSKRFPLYVWMGETATDLGFTVTLRSDRGDAAVLPFAVSAPRVQVVPPPMGPGSASGSLTPDALGVYEEGEQLSNLLASRGLTQLVRCPPDFFLRHWIGYTSFRALLVSGLDLGGLDNEQITALRGWIAAGGILFLAPAGEPHFFRSRIVRTFFTVRVLGTDSVTSLPGIEDLALPPQRKLLLYRLQTEDRRWEELWRYRRLGRGGVYLFRTPLDFVAFLPETEKEDDSAEEEEPPPSSRRRRRPIVPVVRDRGPAEAYLFSLIERNRATPLPFDPQAFLPLFNIEGRSMRRGFIDIRSGEIEDAGAEFLSLLLEGVSNLPSVGVLAALFLVYILVVGPLNYLFLKRRGFYGLMVVTVPATAALFIFLIVLVGFAYKGRGEKASRVEVLHFPPGGGSGMRYSLLAFRVSSGGDHSFRFAEPVYPLLSGDKRRLSRAVDQTDGFEIQDLRLKQWDISFVKSFEPVELGEGLVLGSEGGGSLWRLSNRTGRNLGPGLLAVGEDVFARVPAVAAGQDVAFPVQKLRRSDRKLWIRGNVRDPMLLMLRSILFRRNRGASEALLVAPIDDSRELPRLDGEAVRLVQDRAYVVVRKGGSGP
jgi:hypothetical protein